MSDSPNQRRCAAFVVGIDNYELAGRIPALRFASKDATALAELLTDPAVCGFPKENVLVLTDARADRDSLIPAMSKWLPGLAQDADLAVIFFAGHGIEYCDSQGTEGFLLSHNADPDEPFVHGISMREIARCLQSVHAKATLILLNCGQAGAMVPARARAEADCDFSIGAATINQLAGRGRVLMVSCGEGQKSLESADFGHSLFAHHLFNGIRGKADHDRDGRVGLSELYTYVQEAVEADASTRFQRTQQPWVNAQLNEDVYISAPGKLAAAAHRTPPKRYLYISDVKVDILLAQIPETARRRLADELDCPLEDLTRDAGTPGVPLHPGPRVNRLRAVVRHLEQSEVVGPTDGRTKYVKGTMPMTRGLEENDPAAPAFWVGSTGNTIVSLGGAKEHIIRQEADPG